MKFSRKAAVWSGIFILLIAAVLFHRQILWQLGAMLVDNEPPRKADAVIVLGGDSSGRRILKAGELVRQGFAPKVLVSGAKGYWGHHESYYAIQFAVDHGYARDIFVPIPIPAVSTAQEASIVIAEMSRMGIHKVLLVTSTWHTGRAAQIFRHQASGVEIYPVGAEDPRWNNGRWWADREAQKIWLGETEKVIANRLGI